jgi:hypothetical protein
MKKGDYSLSPEDFKAKYGYPLFDLFQDENIFKHVAQQKLAKQQEQKDDSCNGKSM